MHFWYQKLNNIICSMGGLPVLPMFAVAGLALTSIAYCAGLSRLDSFSTLPMSIAEAQSIGMIKSMD
jgi:hypothetical protein